MSKGRPNLPSGREAAEDNESAVKKAAPLNGDGDVGYRRPPKHARFQPGQSGNPRGRPKGKRSIGATIQGILDQKVSVTENGKIRRVSKLEVIFRRLANDAMRADPRAMKLLLELAHKYRDPKETEDGQEQVGPDDRKILKAFLEQALSSERQRQDGRVREGKEGRDRTERADEGRPNSTEARAEEQGDD